MRSWIIFILIFAITLASPLSSLAQTPVKQNDDTIVVSTTEVMLDAIVKDKKGHIVKELKASDFEIYEDGVLQQVQSFRFITRESKTDAPYNAKEPVTKSSSETPATKPFVNTNHIGAVALVFDRLSLDARSRARQAALSYIGQGLRSDDFVGVFNVDLSLKVLQSFTNNEQLVKQAIERAAAQNSSSYNARTERITNLSQNQAGLQSQADALQATAGEQNPQAADAIGANAIQQQFNEMTLRAEEAFEQLERNQQGYAATDGLLAIISSMRRLPGRKAIIFFSEGVSITPAVAAHFRSVIGNANRANVSIYTIDAAGLRALSSDIGTGQAMTALGQRRLRQANSANDNMGPMTRDLERNEDLLRLNPESGLGQLANETGGLFISNTNDPGPRLRQIDDDLHAYYVLTYIPKNQNYDGRFRQINVKVNRSGVEVQSRKGYYAIDASFDSPVLGYEAPALAILSGKLQSNAFNAKLAAFSFPETNKFGLVPVLVEVPAGSVNFIIDSEKKIYHTDFSIVAIIKDESQRVVGKLSNQYLLTGPLDKIESAKRGKILFYRETELDPGRYTVASVVYDATTRQASADTSTIFVQRASPNSLRLSSIVLIKSAEQLSAIDKQKPNPFHFGDVMVYPNIGKVLSKSTAKDIVIFMTIYTAQGSTATPKLKLEIMQNGHTLGQSVFDPPTPDQTGRIQSVSAIAIDKFQPGQYELKLTAQDDKSAATCFERFTIVP
jgi:VWFA-related protein